MEQSYFKRVKSVPQTTMDKASKMTTLSNLTNKNDKNLNLMDENDQSP